MSYFKLCLSMLLFLTSSSLVFSQGHFMSALTELRSFDDRERVMGKVELLHVHEDIEEGDKVGDHSTPLDTSTFFFGTEQEGDSLTVRMDRFYTRESHYEMNGARYVDVIINYDVEADDDPLNDLNVAVIPIQVDKSLSEKVRENGKAFRIYECDTTADGGLSCDPVRTTGAAAEMRRTDQDP